MKRFILQIALYMILFGSSMILVLLWSNRTMRNNAYVRINQNTKFIVLGHSHPEVSLNDSLIANFSNCASSAEPYFYTFSKAKKIMEQNKKIEVVFIEFSNNQINKVMDDWTWDKVHISGRYPRIAPFLDYEDHKLLLEKNPLGFLNALSLSLNRNLTNIVYKSYDYSSLRNGYLKRGGSKVDSLLKASQRVGEINNCETNISLENIHYLEKIIKYCNENNKKVILIRCPVHKMNPSLCNEAVYKHYLTTTFSKTAYLDFKNFPLLDSEFNDLEHLNTLGANKFSVFFDDLLKAGLLNQKNKQQFIDEKMKKTY